MVPRSLVFVLGSVACAVSTQLFSLVSDDAKPLAFVDNAVAPERAVKEPIYPTKKKVDPSVPINGVIDNLPEGYLYVIRHTEKLLVNDSPAGLVTVKEFATNGKSLVIPGRFVDGDGTFEVREYTEPFVYLIAPKAKGTVELLVNTSLERSATNRVPLNVSGEGGITPPPGPVVDPLVKALQDAYNLESEEEKKFLPTVITFYDSAASLLKLNKTWVSFFVGMQKRAEELKVDGKLVGVKSVVQGELKKVFPSGKLPDDLEIPDPAAVTKKFDQVVAALKKVK